MEFSKTPESTFAGIAASSMTYRNDSEGVEDTLPSTVFAIVNGDNSFQISTERAGTAVTFTDIGTGNAHKFEMAKKNEKSIITIDNLIQHPLSFTSVNHTLNGSIDSTSTTIFSLSGISSIQLGDILRVDDEYMKVTNVGFGTTTTGPISGVGTTALVDVTRGFVGSAASTHTSSGIATVYRGAYNISGNKIFFVDPPRGNANEARDIRNLEYPTSDFSGRVYFRSSYDSNEIFDDISDQFTGIGRTFNVTVGGANTSGAGTTETSGRSGILLINGIFQSPTTSNNPEGNYEIIDTEASGGDPGITTVIFRGMRQLDDSSVVVTSDFDVNQNQLPRGGIVVSLGSTGGLGYAPLAGASVTSVIDATGAFVSVGLGTTDNHGSGYSGIVSVSVYDPTQDVGGDPASISATVGVGGTLIFSVDAPGTGYNNPKIFVSEPSYENLSVVGISRLGEGLTTTTGIGLSMSVVVGASSTSVGIGSTHFEVQSFKMTNSGYSFRKGDKFTLAGLVTDGRLSEPLETFTLEVTDTYEDKFAFWRFGDLDYIDSIANYQNGTRRRFPLFYNNGQLISFEGAENANINFSNILIVFVNGILQTPGESYEFNGGTSFTFNEAPTEDDVVDIFFYRGTSGSDSKEVINIKPLIERGDDVQIIGISTSPITQDLRTIFDISSSDKIETNAYRGLGIEDQILRPISIIKQKRDRFVNGDFVYKTRDSLEPEIYPTAKIIGNISSSGITSIFVDNAEFFDTNVGSGETYNALVVSGSPDPVAAGLTATVGVGGTISDLTIVSGGSGYTSTPTISISAPPVGVGTFIKSDGTVGVGSTATATAIVSGGSISGFTITNPGLGYSETYPPQVIVSLPSPSFENISNFDVSATKGYSGIITGIGTTSISNNLALKFSLHKTSSYGSLNDLEVGYPIHISNTVVGSGVTSLHQSGVGTVGIGTTFVDNIYHVAEFSVQGSLGILTCHIQDTSVVGLATTGSIAHPVGEFSWGRLTNSLGLTRSSSPISIGVTGLTVDSGLTTFPTIQRRGTRIGIRDTGALKKKLN